MSMRLLPGLCLRFALSVCVGAALLPSADAQRATTAIGVGAGAMGPGTDLGPDVSISVERRLQRPAFDLPVLPRIPGWSLGVEAETHVGFEHSADRWLVGVAAVPRIELGPPTKTRFYFVPLAAGVHVGQFDTVRARDVVVRPAYGNGLGLDVPTPRGAVWAEVRVMQLAFDEGGSLAVRTGYRF